MNYTVLHTKLRPISLIFFALSNACVLERISSLTWSAMVVAIVRYVLCWLMEKRSPVPTEFIDLLKDRIMCSRVFYLTRSLRGAGGGDSMSRQQLFQTFSAIARSDLPARINNNFCLVIDILIHFALAIFRFLLDLDFSLIEYPFSFNFHHGKRKSSLPMLLLLML